MDIRKDNLKTLWFEDKAGNCVGEPDFKNEHTVPKKAVYQVTIFPTELTTTYLKLTPEEGEEIGSRKVYSGTSSWPEDLVLAIANSDDYFSLSEAIIIAGTSCERCMNVLAFEYGLDWGYAEGSEEWGKTNTSCQFCEGIIVGKAENTPFLSERDDSE